MLGSGPVIAIGAEAGEIGLWLWTEAEAGDGAGEVGETEALAEFVLGPRRVCGHSLVGYHKYIHFIRLKRRHVINPPIIQPVKQAYGQPPHGPPMTMRYSQTRAAILYTYVI